MSENKCYCKQPLLVEKINAKSNLKVLAFSPLNYLPTTLTLALQQLGYEIHHLVYRKDHINDIAELAQQKTVDAIIIHVSPLPAEGYEICSQLRYQHKLDKPIILCNIRESQRTEGFLKGATLCLNVATSLEEAKLRIAREIENYRARRNLPELKLENEELNAKLASKEEFFQTLSHDLKNPLSIIYGSAAIIRQQITLADTFCDEALNNIVDSVQEIDKLLSRLLHLEKMESNQALDWEQLPFLNFLAVWVESFQHVATNARVKLTYQALSDDGEVEFDYDRMIHALSNLIANAIKYTPAGGQVVVTGIIENPEVKIIVADTGIGIEEEAMPHIFERFYRSSQAKQNHEGTGLGLAISKAIIEKHNGTIAVQSFPGEGTKFIVSLPLKQPHAK